MSISSSPSFFAIAKRNKIYILSRTQADELQEQFITNKSIGRNVLKRATAIVCAITYLTQNNSILMHQELTIDGHKVKIRDLAQYAMNTMNISLSATLSAEEKQDETINIDINDTFLQKYVSIIKEYASKPRSGSTIEI